MCKHLNVEVIEYESQWQGEAGIEFEIVSHTYCRDCWEEIEVPASEVLAVDPEPTRYEIEQNRLKQNHVIPF